MRRGSLSANFLANATGTLVTIIISLVTVPIFVHRIGDARYGVLAIVWLLLGYFGFLDLGLSRASTNALAQIRDGSAAQRSSVVAAALISNLVIGCVGAVVLYFAGVLLITTLVQVPPEIRPEIVQSLPWVAAFLPMALVSGVAVAILDSDESFATVNVLQTISAVLGQSAPVICAIYFGPSLSIIIPVAVLARAFGVAVMLVYVAASKGPWASPRFDRSQLGRLFSYGGWVTVSSLLSPILDSVDQLVIGATLGVSAVTYYAIPMSLVVRSQFFAVALSRALFPRLARLDQSEANRLAERAVVTLGFGYGAVCGGAIIAAKPFLAIWISPAFSEVAGPIASLLMVGAWLNGLAFIPFSLLQAHGRPDLTAKFHAYEILPFLGILWILASQFGLMGAAVAWTLRVAIDAALLMRASRLSAARMRPLAAPGLCLAACCTFAWLFPLNLVPGLLWGGAAAMVIAALGAGFDQELRRAGFRLIARVSPEQV